MKRKATKVVPVLMNLMSDKGLLSVTYTELSKTSKKTTQFLNGQRPEEPVYQEDTRIANKHMKKY